MHGSLFAHLKCAQGVAKEILLLPQRLYLGDFDRSVGTKNGRQILAHGHEFIAKEHAPLVVLTILQSPMKIMRVYGRRAN